ncbi:hypothetical protein HMPREF0868_0110 [Mageeibacillus indolicus UPII9-5]|uniref:Uncharacterized protein n=1 Tax=Mageeibacillus indolicus (strain UPII9-5) TaxID=699246 RepID=D3QZV5_MAGIU|nr:hypothetical protein HMPREF0868_0110 [Mageeibacillus indolicus UPII9-5]
MVKYDTYTCNSFNIIYQLKYNLSIDCSISSPYVAVANLSSA